MNKKKQEEEVKRGQVKPVIVLPSKEETLRRLFQETEEPIEKLSTDTHLDAINDIKKALSSTDTASSIELMYISKDRNGYKPRFPKEYYVQLYRFKGIIVTEENEKALMKNKPMIFARRTLEVIYNRYPRGTVRLLRAKNVKVNGTFLFKHFQHLSPLGLVELDDYIKDAVRLMQESSYWSQFLRKLSKLNNKPYQLDCFDND